MRYERLDWEFFFSFFFFSVAQTGVYGHNVFFFLFFPFLIAFGVFLFLRVGNYLGYACSEFEVQWSRISQHSKEIPL